MVHQKRKGLFEEIYRAIRKIPKGKVATYGQTAELVNSLSSSLSLRRKVTPRIVGFALHANKNPKVPCHRVVNKEGGLAANFAFDGPKEQKRRLLAEGISFIDDSHVNLEKHTWKTK